MELLKLLKDEAFPFSYIDHTRIVTRAIILNDNNEVYLINVERDDDFGNASYLETPGGGVKDGEELEEALLREIKEECGFVVDIVSEIGLVEDDYNIIHRHNKNYYYLCRIKEVCSSEREEYETLWFKSLKFYNLDEVINICKHPNSPIEQVVYNREVEVYLKVKEMLRK